MLIYKKGASELDQCAHQMMNSRPDPHWHDSTVVGNWMAYYHEAGLYSVWHLQAEICCLVYAKDPYRAIEKIQKRGRKER